MEPLQHLMFLQQAAAAAAAATHQLQGPASPTSATAADMDHACSTDQQQEMAACKICTPLAACCLLLPSASSSCSLASKSCQHASNTSKSHKPNSTSHDKLQQSASVSILKS
jgi:hypothetical protein